MNDDIADGGMMKIVQRGVPAAAGEMKEENDEKSKNEKEKNSED